MKAFVFTKDTVASEISCLKIAEMDIQRKVSTDLIILKI